MATIQNPNTNILVNTWTNLYSNITPVEGFTDKVRIVVEVGSGSIKLSNNSTGVTAVTVGYGNLYDGTARSIAFEGNLTQVNNALLSLQAYNNDPNQLASLKISAVKGGSAYNSVNGHYYEAVYVSDGISWEAAKTAAASRSFNGYTGYLATVTSEEENKFILDKLPADGWIGATDKASEGTWKWDTGPEAGQTLSYMNWNSDEPNNATSHEGSPEGEDYGQFYVSGGTPGKWNDLPGAGAAAGKLSYYVVEYGGLSSESATEQANISTTLYVQATPVITSNDGGTTATINYAENGTSAVTTVTATDADNGDTKAYSIVGGADAAKFSINAGTGALTFQASPNYEAPADNDTNNSYLVTVRVTDSTGLFDEQTLTVNVTDANEAISFTSTAPAAVTITDTAEADTFTAQTGTLTASDIDGDAPIFTIDGGTNASGFSTKADTYGLLTVNSSTGEYSYTPDAVKVNSLAVDSTATSTFTLQVSDGKGSTATQTLTINLTGANDRPVLQADDSTNEVTKANTLVNLPTIAEDTPTQGQTIGNLLAARVTDVDLNSSFGGILITANAATASEGTWKYKVSGGSWQNLPDGLSDTNALALAATTSLRFAPAQDYNGSPGQLTVVATDNVFTGYTTNDAPSLVTTVDNTSVSATSKTIGIRVSPVNDAPVITGTLPTTSTQTEDVAGNVDLSALSISDVDSTQVSVKLSVPTDNGKLTASDQGDVTVSGSDSATLTLTGTTADVSAYLANSSAIQYLGAANANGEVTLTVSYKDADSTDFASLGTVTLNIAAVNDAPIITSGSEAETLSVDYLESRTDAVTTIVANDTADSGTVTYSISGGADADLFQIDVTSGALTFKNRPNFEIPSDSDNNNTYLVTVRATDAGTPTPALFDEQTITVTVTDDTSAADPIETGGTEPVTINAPVDDATLNITGSSTTTVENPVGDLNIANNGSGTALVTGLLDGKTVNATGTGETSIQEPAGDLSIANSGSGTVTVQGDLAGNKVTIADTGIGKVVINNSGTSAVTVDSVNNGQTIGTSGTGPTTINNPDGNLSVENTGTGTVSVDGLNTGATLTTSGTGPTTINNPDGNLSVINNGTGTTTVANLNDDAVLNVNGTGPTVVSKPDADMQLVNNSTSVVTVDEISSGSVFTNTGPGPATITNPAGNLRINNTGAGTITVEDIKPGSTLTTTGTKPVNLDLSHLTSGDSVTVDNDGSGTVNMLNVPAGVVVNTTGSTGPTKITDPAGSFSINNTGVGVVTVEGDLAGDTLTIDGTGTGPVAINNTGTTPVTIAGVNNNQTIKTIGTGPTVIADPDASLVVDHSGSGALSVTGLKQDATLTTTGTSPTSVNDPIGNLGVANNGAGAVTVNGLNAGAKLNASGTGPTTISNPEGSLSVGNTGTGLVTVSGDLAGDTVTIDGTGTGPVAINNTGTTAVTIASVNEGQTITTRGTGPTTISSPDGSLSVDNTGTGAVTVDGLATGKTVTTTGTGATSITNPAGDVGVTNNGTGTVTVNGLDAGKTVTTSGSGPTTISAPEGSLSVSNTGTGAVTINGLKADAVLNTSGDKPVVLDLSHLKSGDTITIDNDGSGVVNLVNVPQGVTVVTTDSSNTQPINYAPTISGVPATAQGVTVGSTASLADFTVDDRDATTLRVTLTTTNGSIGGLTDADAMIAGIQLTGPAIDINTALAAATFTAASAGAATIAISVTDGVANPTAATYKLTASNPSVPGPAPTPTQPPTEAPTPEPTEPPVTQAPTPAPTEPPVTQAPTPAPTEPPVTQAPTPAPTEPPVTQAPTPAPTETPTPAPTVETIDGTQVESGTVVKSDGSLTESVTVLPVLESRTEDSSTNNATLADIPLFWGESTRTQQATTVSLPTGVGLVTEGSRAPVVDRSIEEATNDLVQLIDENTSATDSSKVKMLSGGEAFLQNLSAQSIDTLVINKVTLTVSDSVSVVANTPILITGTATPVTTSTGVSALPVEALVIDTRSLPKGSVLNLQNIEFAVIVGDGVQVTGGEGANIVFAGAGSQTLILGEGDDELHGGDDNDIVGSKGGNDQLFGDAGDDVLFGGTGNDALTGGTGIDIALFKYALNEYQIRQNSDGSWTVSHSIEGTDTLKEIEFAEFADQTISLAGNNQWLNVLFQQNISLF